MLDQFQVVARIEREFPRFQPRTGLQDAHQLEDFDFAPLLTDLYEEHDDHALRVAFALLEIFLSDGNCRVREWVGHAIENLHDLAAWKPCGREVFISLLGEQSSRIWTALNRICEAAIGSDHGDASVFEAELATWRVVREAVRVSAGECPTV
jgi:hypothetical protein